MLRLSIEQEVRLTPWAICMTGLFVLSVVNDRYDDAAIVLLCYGLVTLLSVYRTAFNTACTALQEENNPRP